MQALRIQLVVVSLLDYYAVLRTERESIFKATLLIPIGFIIYFALCTQL